MKYLYAYIFILLSFINLSCQSQQLTPEDRKQDILFLAQWAKDYSPFVELNKKYKHCPDYDSLKIYYASLTEKAKDDEEFFRIVNGYFRLIGASGHCSLLFEGDLKYYINEFKNYNPTDISLQQYNDALYWARLIQNIPVFAHPPFLIKYNKGEYFVDDSCKLNNLIISKGAKITKVNGASCNSFLKSVKKNTWVRFGYNKDWIDEKLLLIDEGKDFKGWDIEFLMPDNSKVKAFVPKVVGYPEVKDESENCRCLELSDDVGYIRIKSFSYWSIVKDGKLIRDFLYQSKGKYKKLIVDIRNNGGGATNYFYDVLIKPFLNDTLTYKQKVGIRKKFLSDTKNSYIEYLRKYCSTLQQGVTDIVEINPPEEFKRNDWTFYEVTRKINPANRYDFKGKLFILTGNCFSAADDYANIIKRTKLGTLVGQSTNGGGAAYFAPVFVRLPESGMILMLEADLLINPDGTYNELIGTKPDIELAPIEYNFPASKSDLMKDEWIKKVILEL